MTFRLPPFLFCATFVAALAFSSPGYGQQPAAADLPPGATPAPALAAAPFGPPDPKVIQQLETLLNQKFSRDTYEIFQSVERTGKGRNTAPNVADRFMQDFRMGDWGKIRAALAAMPPELAGKIYDKILADLTEKPKPNMHLDDVLALADAVPGEFTWDQVHRLGQLLGLAVPMNESYWLGDRLQHGTEKLGGTDPAKRLLAGRILLAGGFKDLARAWLPPLDQVAQIPNEGLRNELTAFLSTQQESENAKRGQVQRLWEENIRVLINPKVTDAERQRAAQALAKVVAQVSPGAVAPVITELVQTNPDGAVQLVTELCRRLQNERNGDIANRTENLQAQATLANLIAGLVPPGTEPWSQLFEMMADYWCAEAQRTPSRRKRRRPATSRNLSRPRSYLLPRPARRGRRRFLRAGATGST